MTLRQALASALHFFVVFAFFALGLFFVCIPYLPQVQEKMVVLFTNQFEVCTFIGFWIFAASFILLLGFFALNQGRFLRIEMGGHLAEIDVHIVRQTLDECLKKNFPKLISLNDVEIGKRIEINVAIAPLEEEVREELFIKTEKALETLLKERFGYTKPFHLIVKD